MRTYRLTNEPEGLGLSCTAAGLSLAGTPLLKRTDSGFAPRPAAEIGLLMKAAYGADADATRLESSLQAIARALNGGELARAAIAAVLTRTPELTQDAARRLAAANDNLAKYDPDQPRDWHGRWTSDDAGGPASSAPLAGPEAARQPADSTDRRDAADQAEVSGTTENGAAGTTPQTPTALEQELESQYDDLGPVEFAKQVLQFGDQLARGGASLPPTEKDRTLAEYTFLEDRLSFWLAYEYTPPTAQGNLLSAAQALFQGAMLSGIAQPGHLPKSMLDVAADVWANDNPPLRPRYPGDPAIEIAPEPPEAPFATPKEVEGLGGTVDNGNIGIVWGKGIAAQGNPFETYVERQIPTADAMPATAKTFDQFDEATGTAISDKTLNTASISYIRNPQQIYWRLKQYVDAAADYEPWAYFDADPATIQTRMIQLAIPEYTSPTQWRYLFWALKYGSERGVWIEITRIRE
jgi:hypothetical protein